MIEVDRLADVFVQVADTLVADFDLIDFFHTLALRAAEVSGGAVGLMLADERDRLHVMGASDEGARALEVLQLEHSEGPCLDCFRTGVPVVVNDLAEASGRWPAFAPLAVAEGMQSVHAFPMRLRDRVLGAMNVFGRTSIVLAEEDVRVVQALADIATIGIIQEQAIARAEVVNEQLQAALNSRVVIEQAKGAVSRAMSVGVDEAFDLIRTRARHERVPLTQFAAELVTSPTTLVDRLAGGPAGG